MRFRRSKKNFGCPDVSWIVTSRYSAAGYRVESRNGPQITQITLIFKKEAHELRKILGKWEIGGLGKR
jgi:hypothetical protein